MGINGVYVLATVVTLCAPLLHGLENGLARTPPMGWLAWERFRCNTDCKNDPDNCISDKLFRTMTDLVISEGYADVGYEYINIDDCWLDKERSYSGHLQPDAERFPYGIRDLSDYVHSKGLKFGIYEDYGNYTCAGYPGSLGYLEADAHTFASWNVDYVKLDGCYSHPKDMDIGYPEFGFHLNRTGKAMVYSCSWPVYQIYAGSQPNFTKIIENCNLWRNFDDIQDSWASLESIIDYYGNNQDNIIPNAGPGHWNDPDMLIIGNFGLSYEQSKVQMAMWAILAAPLLMSVDLRSIRPEYKAILQNKKIIAVDQDPLGIQGRRIYKHKGIEIWARPITPISHSYFSYAVAFLNRRTDGTPSDVAVTLQEMGLVAPGGYRIEDLYEDVDYGVLTPQTKIKVKVNPSGGEYAARYNDKSLEFTDVMTSDGKYSVVCRFKEKVVESEFMVSKKNTKHNAALNMIRLLGLDIPAEVESSYADMNQDYKKTNHIGILQNLAIKQKETPPLYELDNESSPQEFKFKCSYKKITLTGCGKSKQEAKSAAAALVLSQLQSG